MEKLFLPLDLTLSICEFEDFKKLEDIASWSPNGEFQAFYGAGCTKAITWEQGFNILLTEIDRKENIFDLFLQVEAYGRIRLMTKNTVHDTYFTELAEGKENIFYHLMGMLKLI